MKPLKHLLFCAAALLCLGLSAQTKPEMGKYYLISMKTNSTQYMAESADGSLGVTAKDNTQRIFWEFVPTDNADCYYIKNATTGHYIMSCNGTNKDQIYARATPVEYYVGVNSGYVRFTSTDCANYANTSSSPKGLNKDGGSSNVIVWAAGASNNNSWWKLTETTYDYETRPVQPHTDFMRAAQIYDNPCAAASDIYIAAVKAQGDEATDLLSYPLSTDATGKPTEAYNIYTKQKTTLFTDANFSGTITLSKAPQEGDALYIYFDFDRDGEYETLLEPVTQRETPFTVAVPKTAKLGQTRMRVRLTNNGLKGADEEACGHIMDFILRLEEKKIDALEAIAITDGLEVTLQGRTFTASPAEEVSAMNLYSTQGQLVARSRSHQLSAQGLPAGAYILKVTSRKHGSDLTAKVLVK